MDKNMKQYLLSPFSKGDFKNKIFESPYIALKNYFKSKNINLNTYDLGNIKDANKILFFNHNKKLLKECQKVGI